ncbi:hypothetical protein BEN47_03715 [Hymenobacter lapidarius]|uniref:Outer membrane protein beta-barrel domain-containing protein n=1 Tax=Hymenobacter lapidarius TaxID=1908237 RepID=A0A1G1SXR3_9BACT|nr:hypothetical protein [Hymenobacter lapidarius]OGX83408.1 hypothetical protein BEN47_03715 [Hymenobacter lapidarius]
MNLRYLLLWAVMLLGCTTVYAQASGPEAPHWSWGARLGLGQGRLTYGNNRREYADTYLSPSGGLTLGYYLPKLRASVHAEALYTTRTVRLTYTEIAAGTAYYDVTANSHHLFMPVYLRTGRPSSLFHFLAGAGPTFHLGTNGMPGDAPYFPRRTELTGLLGLELRLAPVRRTETTVDLHLRVPFTPAYEYGAANTYIQGGQVIYGQSRTASYAPWLGLTAAFAVHPRLLPQGK